MPITGWRKECLCIIHFLLISWLNINKSQPEEAETGDGSDDRENERRREREGKALYLLQVTVLEQRR